MGIGRRKFNKKITSLERKLCRCRSKLKDMTIMSILDKKSRIVVKIGSNTLTHSTGKLNLRRMETLVRTLSDFCNSGHEIILVSSGAVAAGISKLGLDHRPVETERKMALAAVGQAELMQVYERLFAAY